MEYVRCLEILQLIKQAIEQESFERISSDFNLLEIKAQDDITLLCFIATFKTRFQHYQKNISSDISKQNLKSEYGKVFRKIIELIQLSDLSKLNI